MSAPRTLEPVVGKVTPLMRGWFHVAALAGVLVAGPLLIARAHGAAQSAVLSLYVFSIASLFGVSSAFHRITWSPSAHRRLRRADHVTIFLAIAGTYTAVAYLALHGWARTLVLCVVWGGATGGIALRQLWLDAPKWAVAVPYVVVGWSALAVVPQLVRGLGGPGFALVLLGGAFYTAGAVVYARRRPDPFPQVFGFHEIFHACTVVGATLHFVAVAAYALPRS
ncbi:MAG: channel protein hemolysin family [Acidimicrobiaceae bacterium]|jgi:hemolysin III|nr:channel protein hemolysin family [Acidimicrobiaceae bacterium]